MTGDLYKVISNSILIKDDEYLPLNFGDILLFLGEEYKNKFYKVLSPSGVGWVENKFIEKI